MIRKAIRLMQGYIPGEQPQNKVIKLNTNENPYALPPSYYEDVRTAIGENLRLYPDPLCVKLREKLAVYHQVKADNILCANGSDEILRLAFDLALEPEDKVGILDPTYSLYPVLNEIREGVLQRYTLDENGNPDDTPFSFQGKLFLIASPNPPYGNSISRYWIKSFLNNFRGLVVIDEAYVDFAEDNWVSDIQNYPQLIVSRTYSKSFSLAGIRFGYAIAQDGIIKEMLKIKDSYNVNTLTQVAALKALDYREVIQVNIQKIIKTRDWLSGQLSAMGWKVYPSQSNFVFAEYSEARKVYEKLKLAKIYVRYFNTPRLSKGIRITVGTQEECEKLLRKIKEILSDKN